MTDVRAVAYETLLIAGEGNAGNNVIKDVLDKYSYLDKKDRSFLKRLIEGTLERRITIDYIIDRFSKVATSKMKKQVRCALRMGAYQLMYMDQVPDHAAIDESVAIIKKTPQRSLSGFVNAVLRNIQRNREKIEWPDREKDEAFYLSVMYSMPPWIVKMLIKEQGAQNAEAVMALSQSVRPVTARINITKVNNKSDLGEYVNPLDICDEAVQLTDYDNIADIPAVAQGLVCVQDISSVIAVKIAGIKEGDTVLDLCAAPGGKSLHAADLTPHGRVISVDVSKKKVSRIEENAARCGFKNIETLTGDSGEYNASFDGSADVVIADVPCSGLGVMGRKNDIKYNLTEEAIDELVPLQRKILSNAARYVKKGGTLLFSTCTVSKRENQQNAEYLVSECGLRPEGFYDLLPEAVRDESAKEGWLQLYGRDGLTDGFFMAKFVRDE